MVEPVKQVGITGCSVSLLPGHQEGKLFRQLLHFPGPGRVNGLCFRQLL